MDSTFIVLVQWFLRVVTWLLIELDIPQLSSNGIRFGSFCFQYTYSLQSSSIHSLISSSFDAIGLENYISFGDKTPSSTSYVVRNRTELSSIPLDVEDLWIGRLDTSGLTEFPFNRFQSLKSLVIGNSIFWGVTSFELSNLPQLQSVKLGWGAFCNVHSIVFESDWMDGLMIQICQNYNPFTFLHLLFVVMSVMIERRLTSILSTSRTHWQCEVRLNEVMNE